MHFLKAIWDFFQNQMLGMKWLNELIGSGLYLLGLDTTNRWIGSIQFLFMTLLKLPSSCVF